MRDDTVLNSGISEDVCVPALSHSVVFDFVTPWVVARQAPLFMGFSRQETGVGCHALLQGIFLFQGSNPCLWHLLHWQADSLPLRHLEAPSEDRGWGEVVNFINGYIALLTVFKYSNHILNT